VTGNEARRSYRTGSGWREAGRFVRLSAVAGLAVSSAACSLAIPIGSIAREDPVSTQSVGPRAVSPLSPDLGEEDWRRARAALAVALDPQGSGSQVSWDNPDTALKGSFTPVGQPFVKSDEICRAFLASVAGTAGTSSLQGTACRPSGGEWSIRDVKPFKKV
jgi:surface antigen